MEGVYPAGGEDACLACADRIWKAHEAMDLVLGHAGSMDAVRRRTCAMGRRRLPSLRRAAPAGGAGEDDGVSGQGLRPADRRGHDRGAVVRGTAKVCSVCERALSSAEVVDRLPDRSTACRACAERIARALEAKAVSTSRGGWRQAVRMAATARENA